MSMNMEDFGANEQAMASGHKPAKKGGRKPKLTEDQKRENKLKSCRKYRRNKDAKDQALQEKNQELEKENENLKEEKEMKQSEINSLNKELSEAKAQVDKLEADLSAQSKIVNMVKKESEKLNATIEQMQHDFLSPFVQDDVAFDDIPMDFEFLNNLENCGDSDETTDSMVNEGASIAKTKLSPLHETVTVKGFRVLRENSPLIQEIFNNYPNIASGLRVHYVALRDVFMNTLAEVYKMAAMEGEKCNLEYIKYMEYSVEDLELAGLDVSWLKDLVAESRKEVEGEEEIKSTEAKLMLLKERQSKLREERESKRQRFSST